MGGCQQPTNPLLVQENETRIAGKGGTEEPALTRLKEPRALPFRHPDRSGRPPALFLRLPSHLF